MTGNRSPPGAGELFDQLVASAQAMKSSQPSEPKRFGLAALRLQAEPKPVFLPRVPRSLAGIDPGLRATIRSLIVGEQPWPLFLNGPAGCGKTCAALCMLDYATGEYFTAAGLCATLIQAQQGQLSWSHEGRNGPLWPAMVWKRVATAMLVVFDEIGARERVSDYHYETVQQLLDERGGLPLVCISNLDEQGIARIYDDRILSRLASGTVVRLDAKDRRIMG